MYVQLNGRPSEIRFVVPSNVCGTIFGHVLFDEFPGLDLHRFIHLKTVKRVVTVLQFLQHDEMCQLKRRNI